MTRILAIIISFFLFSGQVTAGGYTLKHPEAEFSAVILSDMHMEGNNMQRFDMIGKTFKGVFNTDRQPDVVAFAGDNTMNGQNIEWLDFYGFLNRYNKGSDILVAMGNHDFGNTDSHETYEKLSKRAIANYNYYCRENIDNIYYSRDYGCVKFIILGSEDNAENTVEVISDEQIAWLSAELSQCSENNQPAVVINHNLIYGTTGRQSYYDFNQTSNNDKLNAALKDCETKVYYICGHSHFGVSDGSVYESGNVTYINLPSAGNTGNYGAEGENADFGTGLLMEFYDGNTDFSFVNFATGKTLTY